MRGALVAELDRHGPTVEPFSFAHGGRSFRALLVRADQVTAFLNRCPHWNLPLDDSDGDIWTGERLVCSVHGAEFDAESGACTAGPCEGSSLTRLIAEVDGDAIRVFLSGLLSDLGPSRN